MVNTPLSGLLAVGQLAHGLDLVEDHRQACEAGVEDVWLGGQASLRVG
ncbi:MAG: hypothetical protein IT523_00800 [Burkholderiales bacterium]|nr:hypothetical protein [Burkholderiales bacterium]